MAKFQISFSKLLALLNFLTALSLSLSESGLEYNTVVDQYCRSSDGVIPKSIPGVDSHMGTQNSLEECAKACNSTLGDDLICANYNTYDKNCYCVKEVDSLADYCLSPLYNVGMVAAVFAAASDAPKCGAGYECGCKDHYANSPIGDDNCASFDLAEEERTCIDPALYKPVPTGNTCYYGLGEEYTCCKQTIGCSNTEQELVYRTEYNHWCRASDEDNIPKPFPDFEKIISSKDSLDECASSCLSKYDNLFCANYNTIDKSCKCVQEVSSNFCLSPLNDVGIVAAVFDSVYSRRTDGAFVEAPNCGSGYECSCRDSYARSSMGNDNCASWILTEEERECSKSGYRPVPTGDTCYYGLGEEYTCCKACTISIGSQIRIGASFIAFVTTSFTYFLFNY